MNKLKSFSVLLIALAFAATTAEAKGEAGTANGPNVHCLVSASIGRHIVVYPPVMLAIHLPDYLNGTFVLNRQHNQWVAYRATVYRYENGRWVYSSRGPSKATILGVLGDDVLGYSVNLETGRRDTAGSGIGERSSTSMPTADTSSTPSCTGMPTVRRGRLRPEHQPVLVLGRPVSPGRHGAGSAGRRGHAT